MSKFFKFLGFVFVFIFLASGAWGLTIYSYDSFVSYGLSKKVIPLFEKMTGEKVIVRTYGDAGAVLSRLILEKKRPKADLVIGIDQNLLPRALKSGVLSPYKPENITNIHNKGLIFDPTYHVIPYDYGAISIVYDKEKLKNPPESFEELLDKKYKGSLILEDPRTSSTGLAFLYWTIAVYGNDFTKYWKSLLPNILTITSGWDEAFELFSNGEAPMMVSYATDPAYSYENYKSTRYGALIFKEGGYIQIEGAGIVKGTKDRKMAERFIEFMLTSEFQKEIPLTQWMFPVVDVGLPECFKYAAKIDKILSLPPDRISKNQDKWIRKWEEIVVSK